MKERVPQYILTTQTIAILCFGIALYRASTVAPQAIRKELVDDIASNQAGVSENANELDARAKWIELVEHNFERRTNDRVYRQEVEAFVKELFQKNPDLVPVELPRDPPEQYEPVKVTGNE